MNSISCDTIAATHLPPPDWPLDDFCTTEILLHLGPYLPWAQTCQKFYKIHKEVSVSWTRKLLQTVDSAILKAFQIDRIDEQYPYESAVKIMGSFKKIFAAAKNSLQMPEQSRFKNFSILSLFTIPERANELLNVDANAFIHLLQAFFPSSIARAPLSQRIATAGTLTTLTISQNQLSSLPASLGILNALTTLSLFDNQCTCLPESIENLTALTTLHLYGTQLTKLPASFGNLSALTRLSLAHTRLTSLPESIGNLTALTWLSITSNQITSLPESIGNLTALTWLSLYNNQLTSLPRSVTCLTNVRHLDLQRNGALTNHPSLIAILTHLRRHGCTIHSDPEMAQQELAIKPILH